MDRGNATVCLHPTTNIGVFLSLCRSRFLCFGLSNRPLTDIRFIRISPSTSQFILVLPLSSYPSASPAVKSSLSLCPWRSARKVRNSSSSSWVRRSPSSAAALPLGSHSPPHSARSFRTSPAVGSADFVLQLCVPPTSASGGRSFRKISWCKVRLRRREDGCRRGRGQFCV